MTKAELTFGDPLDPSPKTRPRSPGPLTSPPPTKKRRKAKAPKPSSTADTRVVQQLGIRPSDWTRKDRRIIMGVITMSIFTAIVASVIILVLIIIALQGLGDYMDSAQYF